MSGLGRLPRLLRGLSGGLHGQVVLARHATFHPVTGEAEVRRAVFAPEAVADCHALSKRLQARVSEVPDTQVLLPAVQTGSCLHQLLRKRRQVVRLRQGSGWVVPVLRGHPDMAWASHCYYTSCVKACAVYGCGVS